MKETSYDYGIDYFKLLASMCVLGMHVELFKDIDAVLYSISDHVFRFAVPFFFICSGYLFEKHNTGFQTVDEMRVYIKGYVKKLIRPFFIWGGYTQSLMW